MKGSRNERLKGERMHVCSRNKKGKGEWQTVVRRGLFFVCAMSLKVVNHGKHVGIKTKWKQNHAVFMPKQSLTSNTQVFS